MFYSLLGQSESVGSEWVVFFRPVMIVWVCLFFTDRIYNHQDAPVEGCLAAVGVVAGGSGHELREGAADPCQREGE